jgi:hypothetical protein
MCIRVHVYSYNSIQPARAVIAVTTQCAIVNELKSPLICTDHTRCPGLSFCAAPTHAAFRPRAL